MTTTGAPTLPATPDMVVALEAADGRARITSPNPAVGCVVTTTDGVRHVGVTEPPGGRHAEIVALDAARAVGSPLAGATVSVTLEPCSHTGRTGPCAEALVAAGVAAVDIALADPDPDVDGAGIARLVRAGIGVTVGVGAVEAEAQLAGYLHHRRTGRPLVTLKLAATLDGRTAAPDGSSRWITGTEARADVHRLRATHDAVAVGAATVRADDPALDVRHVDGPDPTRVVFGSAPPEARIRPCIEVSGTPVEALATLGRQGITTLLVEGGAALAGDLWRHDLVDRVVVYLAPAIFGGDDARPVLAGPAAVTIEAVRRGRFTDVAMVGQDLRIELNPRRP